MSEIESNRTNKLSRDELIALVNRIVDPRVSDAEVSRLMRTFDASVPHPSASGLIFRAPPEPELTPEEIVDIALGYEPIRL